MTLNGKERSTPNGSDNESEPARPDVSVVVVSFNTRDLLRDCLNTLKDRADDVTYELLVVDNASKDGSADMIAEEFPEAGLIRSDENLGFAGANNRAFEVARGRYIVLLNSDAFVEEGALSLSVRKMDEQPHVGLASGRLVGRDGTWQPSARMFPSVTNELLTLSGLGDRYPHSRFFGRMDRTWADPMEPAEVDWVPGAYSIIRREALERIGYFDQRFFLYYEEVDLCLRIKEAGYELWYWPDIAVVHIGGESARTVENAGGMTAAGAQLTLWRMRSALLYHRKHHGYAGALAAMAAEAGFHRVRAWKNQGSDDPSAKDKVEESKAIVDLLRQAWTETDGGKNSPPQPW